jgi:hypothetical protein
MVIFLLKLKNLMCKSSLLQVFNAGVLARGEGIRDGGVLARGEGKTRGIAASHEKNDIVGPNLVLPSQLWGTIGDGSFFFFAIPFGELPNYKIWGTNYPKLLELL